MIELTPDQLDILTTGLLIGILSLWGLAILGFGIAMLTKSMPIKTASDIMDARLATKGTHLCEWMKMAIQLIEDAQHQCFWCRFRLWLKKPGV